MRSDERYMRTVRSSDHLQLEFWDRSSNGSLTETRYMPQPKKHKTWGGTHRRRSHMALKSRALTSCANCKKPTRPHTVCRHCGSYKGRTVVDIVGKTLAKQEKRKKRAQQ